MSIYINTKIPLSELSHAQHLIDREEYNNRRYTWPSSQKAYLKEYRDMWRSNNKEHLKAYRELNREKIREQYKKHMNKKKGIV